MVVEAAGALDHALKPGDLLLLDRASFLALERIEQSDGRHLFLEETPRETFDDIGGLDKEIRQLVEAIELHICQPDLARKYRLARKRGICLSGPPGTGKTLMARALANHLGRAGRGKSWFMNIKPGSRNSMWFGQSEQNWREAFRVAKETALRSGFPVVIFLDEIDSVGKARGGIVSEIEDRVLNALLAEMDGLEGRGDIVVIGATNRFELLDEALVRPGRLGDLVLEIPRPKRKAAREIFRRHLTRQIPYWANGAGPEASREEAIEAALSLIYAPGGEEGRLATLVYRDGKRQEVRAGDLASGAIIAKVCAVARERAALRELETGEEGLRPTDLLSALGEEFCALAKALRPHNLRHLSNLRQDVDVVAVEPAAPAGLSYRYLRQ